MKRAGACISVSSRGESSPSMQGRPRTYCLRTFGCQMNDHDSERIAGLLEQQGMIRVDRPEEASVIVFNTCSIREKADRRLAAHLEAASRLKTADPTRLVVVAGCLAQSRRELLLQDFPFVDVLVGPQSLHELPALLERRVREGRAVGAFQEFTTRWSADLPRSRREGPSAWVQITAGCTNFCSYCIVPYVRGPEASRPLDDILAEVNDLVKQGVKEVVFLGQNVNAYGKEPGFRGHATFAVLLREACQISGLERIRFMTSHPKDVSEELIAVMAEPNQVCEHLHLPAQSGSDAILAAMRRGYDRASYVDLVRRVREAIPGVAITTDLIVGFPGETEEDFAQTLSLVEECEFDGAFTFIYSPRPHTAAASLPNRVPRAVALERMQRLVELVQETAKKRNEALVGSVVEVMVEGPSRQCSQEVMGRTRTYKPVNFISSARPGDLVMVKLLEATSTSFRGRQV